MTAEQTREAGAQEVTRLAGLFRQHHADLVRLAVLLVRDQPTAEDVGQDVFARLHAKPGRAAPLRRGTRLHQGGRA